MLYGGYGTCALWEMHQSLSVEEGLSSTFSLGPQCPHETVYLRPKNRLAIQPLLCFPLAGAVFQGWWGVFLVFLPTGTLHQGRTH